MTAGSWALSLVRELRSLKPCSVGPSATRPPKNKVGSQCKTLKTMFHCWAYGAHLWAYGAHLPCLGLR